MNVHDRVTTVICCWQQCGGAERDGTVAQPIGGEIPKRALFRANSGRWTVVSFMLQ